MRIANPIYDEVFKYLLKDEKVARLMLSALLGKEVTALSFRPTEEQEPVRPPGGPNFLVMRMDFAATVQLEDGSRKLVLVEIQKARNAWDVQRFRRYLGRNYSNPENVHPDACGMLQPLPILTIYFLGQGLNGIEIPVLKINRHYLDVATGDEVRITDPFVEALTHDSVVVQINRLKDRRRTELERLLAVFDQGQRSHSDPHLLDILEVNFPERYREVLRRLVQAGAEEEVMRRMDLEDEVLAAFQDQARKEADLRQALSEKDKVIGAKDKALEEKEKALEESARQIADLLRRLGGASSAS